MSFLTNMAQAQSDMAQAQSESFVSPSSLPAKYDFIGKNNFNGMDVPGFHSVGNHNLNVGDWVAITNGDQNYVGTYQVTKTSADDGTYEGTIFLINTPYAGGGDGTFLKVSAPVTSVSKNIVDVIRAGSDPTAQDKKDVPIPYDPGQVKTDGGIIPPMMGTPTLTKPSTFGISNNTLLIGGGIAALLLIVAISRR